MCSRRACHRASPDPLTRLNKLYILRKIGFSELNSKMRMQGSKEVWAPLCLPDVKGALALEGRVRVSIGLHREVNYHVWLFLQMCYAGGQQAQKLTTSLMCQLLALAANRSSKTLSMLSAAVQSANCGMLVGSHVMTQPQLADLFWFLHPQPEGQCDLGREYSPQPSPPEKLCAEWGALCRRPRTCSMDVTPSAQLPSQIAGSLSMTVT